MIGNKWDSENYFWIKFDNLNKLVIVSWSVLIKSYFKKKFINIHVLRNIFYCRIIIVCVKFDCQIICQIIWLEVFLFRNFEWNLTVKSFLSGSSYLSEIKIWLKLAIAKYFWLKLDCEINSSENYLPNHFWVKCGEI